MYYVYILRSEKNGRQYIGSTSNIARRLTEHNSGRSTYTRLTKPFRLLRTEEFLTRPEAVRRELFLKSGKGRELLQKLLAERGVA